MVEDMTWLLILKNAWDKTLEEQDARTNNPLLGVILSHNLANWAYFFG